MRRTGAIIAIAAALAACGHPPKPAASAGSGSAAVDAGVAPDAAPVAPVATSPTRDECAVMLGHVFDVAMAARKDPLTPDERAAVRTKMIDANVESCLATSRATYECAMKASTAADLQACPQ
ncbi:MAG: hypothetical protein K8W52_30150 [Deltaproteobacteria bacterium]|nr:hypothetical protein [Deltaproteobacteria bacterium]